MPITNDSCNLIQSENEPSDTENARDSDDTTNSETEELSTLAPCKKFRYFNKHFKILQRSGKFYCCFCPKEFGTENLQESWSEFMEHIKCHPKTRRVKYKILCDVCAKKINRSSYTEHMKTHADGYLFKCSDCPKTYRYKSSLLAHTKVHTGNLFTCRFCNKGYIYKRQLRDHERLHTGEKPYKCKQCEKSFTSMANLYEHRQRAHIVAKPYPCKYCKKSFTEQRHCDTHMKFHTERGERTYKCEDCNEIFKNPRSYIKHVRIHTGEEPYPCDKCKKTFITRKRLHNHYKAKHTIKISEPCGTLPVPIEIALKDHLYFQFYMDSEKVVANTVSSVSDHNRKHETNQKQICQPGILENANESTIQIMKYASHTEGLLNNNNCKNHKVISIEKVSSSVEDNGNSKNQLSHSKKIVTGKLSYTKESSYVCPMEECQTSGESGATFVNVNINLVECANETDEDHFTNDCIIHTDNESNHSPSESHLSFAEKHIAYTEHQEIWMQHQANFPKSSYSLTGYHFLSQSEEDAVAQNIINNGKSLTNSLKEYTNHTAKDPNITTANSNNRNCTVFYKNEINKKQTRQIKILENKTRYLQKCSTLKEQGVCTDDHLSSMECDKNFNERNNSDTIKDYENSSENDTNYIIHNLCGTKEHENFTKHFDQVTNKTNLENLPNSSKKQKFSLKCHVNCKDTNPKIRDQSYMEHSVNDEDHINQMENIPIRSEICLDETKDLGKNDLATLEHESFTDNHEVHAQDNENLLRNESCTVEILSDCERNVSDTDGDHLNQAGRYEYTATTSTVKLETRVKDLVADIVNCVNQTIQLGCAKDELYRKVQDNNLMHMKDNLNPANEYLNFVTDHSYHKEEFRKESSISKESMEKSCNKGYSCAHCSKIFISAKFLLRHLKTHMGSSICSCEYCTVRHSQRVQYRESQKPDRKCKNKINFKNKSNKIVLMHRSPINNLIHCTQASSSGLQSSLCHVIVNNPNPKMSDQSYMKNSVYAEGRVNEMEDTSIDTEAHKTCIDERKDIEDFATLDKQKNHTQDDENLFIGCSHKECQNLAEKSSFGRHASNKIDVFKCIRKNIVYYKTKTQNSKNCKDDVKVLIKNKKNKVLTQSTPKKSCTVRTSDSELGQELGSPARQEETTHNSKLQKKNLNGKTQNNILKQKPPRKRLKKQGDLACKKEHSANPKSSKRKIYECKDCDKTFKYERSWNYHLESWHKRKFFCRYCFKYILGMIDYKKHLQTHKKEKRFTCHYCNKSLRHKSGLYDHLKIHLGQKPYACQYCEKAFRQSTNLRSHMKLHTGENKYTCNYCKKAFVHKRGLTNHIRWHTGEKPFVCPDCNKAFSREDNYKTHLKIHMVDKPFACHVCKRRYTTKEGRDSHLHFHKSRRSEPVFCPLCSKQFSIPSKLKRHMKVHEGKNFYSCSSCDVKFLNLQDLADHEEGHCKKDPYVITVHRLPLEHVPEGIQLIQPHEIQEHFSDSALKLFIQQSQVPITDIYIQSS